MGSEIIARVSGEYKQAYRVRTANGECWAKIRGKQMFNASSREDFPAVGDWVMINPLDNEHAVIQSILPRKTIIKRKYGDKNKVGKKDKIQIIATNIDVAFIVESVDRDFNLNRLERYVAIVTDGGIAPAIILNKIDLISKEELSSKLVQMRARFPHVDCILTSTLNDKGLDELGAYIEKDKTYCFLGSSGVGKSSLINKLLGETAIKTKEISAYSGRGKHTTTKREMYFLPNGGIVIDNPGMREVGMTDVNKGIEGVFDDITALAKKCKYVDCTHQHEPDCAVILAVQSGNISEERYVNYLNLKKETAYFEMSKMERREKDRQFGKFIKKAKDELKRHGY